MFQYATHTIVVLDTAWPWASEDYGFAVCEHTFVRVILYLYVQDTFVRINLHAQDHTLLFPKSG